MNGKQVFGDHYWLNLLRGPPSGGVFGKKKESDSE
jgi:hypothetical protein